jgi:hypothetical protein
MARPVVCRANQSKRFERILHINITENVDRDERETAKAS